MKSILKALYMGNLHFSEEPFPNDSNYRHTSHTIDEVKTTLKDKLSADDADTLERLYSLQQDIIHYDLNESFKTGFCTGALMMLEIMMSRQAETCE